MMIVYAIVDDILSPDFPLGVELEVFILREDAERTSRRLRSDDHGLAGLLIGNASSRPAG